MGNEPVDTNLRARLFDARESVFLRWIKETIRAVRLHVTLINNFIDSAVLKQVDSNYEVFSAGDREELLLPVITAQIEILRQSLEEDLNEIVELAVGLSIQAAVDDATDLFQIANAAVFEEHRRAAAEVIVSQWTRPALKTVNENLWNAVGEEIEKYFQDQELGLAKLKRNIRGLTGTGNTSLDWQWERIARTETTRIHNLMKVAEAQAFDKNRLVRWVGPTDSRTSEICMAIKRGNPYTQEELMQITNNGAPHPNCRHTLEIIPLLDLE